MRFDDERVTAPDLLCCALLRAVLFAGRTAAETAPTATYRRMCLVLPAGCNLLVEQDPAARLRDLRDLRDACFMSSCQLPPPRLPRPNV